MRGFSAFILLAGCSQILGVGDFHTGNGPNDGSTPNDGTGASGDGNNVTPPADALPVGCAQVSTQTNTCSLPAGSPVHITMDSTFDTGSGTLTGSDGTIVAVTVSNVTGPVVPIETIVASTFDIDAGVTLRVTGATAFGVIASDTITIKGIIDASVGGAGVSNGSGLGYCTAEIGQSGTSINGYVGGEGGGGGQGSGGSGGIAIDMGVGGGGAPGAVRPSFLNNDAPIGGCVNLSAKGGGGVYLASATGIVIAAGAGINAGGGGGAAAASGGSGPGGGGAAGGTIMLETPGLVIDGILAANGGGGGEGGAFGTAVAGQPGQLGAVPAKGGNGTFGASGGSGGAGSALWGADGGAESMSGGGGGGGAAGFVIIHTNTQLGSGVISPAPST
jgi:hypothetical protein